MSQVTRMRVSIDDSYLFVTGEDGALMMFDIRDKESRFLLLETTFTLSQARQEGAHVFGGDSGLQGALIGKSTRKS